MLRNVTHDVGLEWGMMMWNGFIWLRVGFSDGPL